SSCTPRSSRCRSRASWASRASATSRTRSTAATGGSPSAAAEPRSPPTAALPSNRSPSCDGVLLRDAGSGWRGDTPPLPARSRGSGVAQVVACCWGTPVRGRGERAAVPPPPSTVLASLARSCGGGGRRGHDGGGERRAVVLRPRRAQACPRTVEHLVGPVAQQRCGLGLDPPGVVAVDRPAPHPGRLG